MKSLAFCCLALAFGASAATPARADYAVVAFHSGFCRIWTDPVREPLDGHFLVFPRQWRGHVWLRDHFVSRDVAEWHLQHAVEDGRCQRTGIAGAAAVGVAAASNAPIYSNTGYYAAAPGYTDGGHVLGCGIGNWRCNAAAGGQTQPGYVGYDAGTPGYTDGGHVLGCGINNWRCR